MSKCICMFLSVQTAIPSLIITSPNMFLGPIYSEKKLNKFTINALLSSKPYANQVLIFYKQ